MKKTIYIIAMMFGLTKAFAGDHNPQAIIPLLKDAKMSLLAGIDFAEKLSGVATSAKFEVEGGKLMLSVYTVPEGLSVEPAIASLSEVSGLVTESPFNPAVEVFSDKEHIATAAVHMTLFQLSKMTLKEVIQRALSVQHGAPIDIRNPMVRNGRPVADVVVVDHAQNAVTVTVDLLNGNASIHK